MKSENLEKLTDFLEKQVLNINQISFDDIRSLQRTLKDEGLYTGKIDADFGGGTARGLLEAFKENPSLLGNASPAIIKLMQEQGHGQDLQEIVAGNDELRNKIISDTRELLTDPKFDKTYTAQQTKLSLLGLYTAKIDGVIGKGHRGATAAFQEQFIAVAPEQENPSVTAELDENIDIDATVVTASRDTAPYFVADLEGLDIPPVAMPLLGEAFQDKANIALPEIIAASVLPVTQTDVTEVATESEADVATAEPEIGLIESAWSKLTGLFGNDEEITPEDTQVAVVENTATEGIVFTLNEGGFSTPDFALYESFRFSADPASRIDLNAAFSNIGSTYVDMDAYRPVLELIVQTEAGGDYDIANGFVNRNYTGKTINQVLDDQLTWIYGRRRAYDEAIEAGEVDPEKVKLIQFEYQGRTSSAAGGLQAVHRTLKHTALDSLGLDGNDLFDETTQLKIGAELLREAGYNDYLTGHIDRDTMTQNIAGVWASFPEKSDGTSPYDNDGINRVLVGHDDVQDTLQHSKDLYARNTASPGFFSEGLFSTGEIGTLSFDQEDFALNTSFTRFRS